MHIFSVHFCKYDVQTCVIERYLPLNVLRFISKLYCYMIFTIIIIYYTMFLYLRAALRFLSRWTTVNQKLERGSDSNVYYTKIKTGLSWWGLAICLALCCSLRSRNSIEKFDFTAVHTYIVDTARNRNNLTLRFSTEGIVFMYIMQSPDYITSA